MRDLKIPVEFVIGQAVRNLVDNRRTPETEEEALNMLGGAVLKDLTLYGYEIVKIKKEEEKETE